MLTPGHRHGHPQVGHLRFYLPWGALGLMLVAAFLLAPGDIAQKAHLALHGVCAQRPSHSLQLGGATLPLDARMTGIYLGAFTTAVWLTATQRLRRSGRPSLSVLVTLALFILIMTADGLNALLFDLGSAEIYQPSNGLRLATGVLAGVALGIGFGHLFAITIWRSSRSRSAIVNRPRELVLPVGVAAALGALALSGLPLLFAPLAIGLLIAVLFVFAALILMVLALGSGRAWRIESFAQLRDLAVISSLLAILVVAVLSGLRLIAEQAFGLPQLT